MRNGAKERMPASRVSDHLKPRLFELKKQNVRIWEWNQACLLKSRLIPVEIFSECDNFACFTDVRWRRFIRSKSSFMSFPLSVKIAAAFVFILAPCGLSVDAGIASAEAIPKWEKEIVAIEQRDPVGPETMQGIVFVGSSSIKRWTSLAKDFPQHRVLNHGFGGSQLTDAVAFLDRIVVPYAPGLIVLYSGGNDINASRTADQVFDSFREFVSRIREKLPSTPIAYISIAGNPKRWSQVAEVIKANGLIETYTKQNAGLVFIDVFHPMLGLDGRPRPEIFSEDNLHMNAKGYQLWKQVVGPYLAANFAQAESR